MPNRSPIFIPQHLYNKILAHALKTPEIEVCGLVFGDQQQTHCIPVPNTSKLPANHYEMSSTFLLSTLKYCRHNQQNLIAIYHSHPTSEAYPSATDIQMAYYPDALYLIISTKVIQNPVINGFHIQQGEVVEIPIFLT